MIGQPIPPSVVADPREIRYVREVAASPTQVYAAFTDPAALATWWGPNGFRTETHAMDVRAGGSWRFTMHGPDGKAWPNFIDYDVVEPGKRLHWRHRGDEAAAPDFEVELKLLPRTGGGTRIEFTMQLPDQAARDAKASWGAAEGGQQTLDRLESLLTGELRLSRRFAAPRERVWRAWAEAAQLAKWWGPAGRTLTVEEFDFRVGGRFHFRMGDGDDAWHAVFEYLAIEPPHRLAYDSAFCDGAMLPCAPPFADDWPVHIRYEITLEEEGGITTLRLRGTPHGATAAQEATFRAMSESMRAGFYATFDQLQSLLTKEP